VWCGVVWCGVVWCDCGACRRREKFLLLAVLSCFKVSKILQEHRIFGRMPEALNISKKK
jgi:endonuclease V-like protein UPF0215 family